MLHIHMELALYRKVSIERRSIYASASLVKAAKKHTSTRYPGDVLYFRSHCVYGRDMRLQGWWNDCFLGFGELCDGSLDGYVVGGGHNDPWSNPNTAIIVKKTFGERTDTSSDE